MDRFIVWIAQGFGVGRVKYAPGTFGSVLGVAWFILLAWPGHAVIYLAGILGGAAASVWICGRAERVLGESDPGSIVLDEIAAMPLCFAAWMWHPSPPLFSRDGWIMMGIVFLLFRIFDVAKPWPVRSSQKLAGGLGVTADDFLAAGYVNLAYLAGGWALRVAGA